MVYLLLQDTQLEGIHQEVLEALHTLMRDTDRKREEDFDYLLRDLRNRKNREELSLERYSEQMLKLTTGFYSINPRQSSDT